jgi:hypothetical protein
MRRLGAIAEVRPGRHPVEIRCVADGGGREGRGLHIVLAGKRAAGAEYCKTAYSAIEMTRANF